MSRGPNALKPPKEGYDIKGEQCKLGLWEFFCWFHFHSSIVKFWPSWGQSSPIIWLATSHLLYQLPTKPIQVSSDLVMPVTVFRDLEILINSNMSMWSHVSKIVSACFTILRQLRSIHQLVPRTVLQAIMPCLVLSRMDYCITVLAGIPLHIAWRMQSVMHAAARLVYTLSSSLYSYINCTDGWNFHGKSTSSCQ